jgi:selenium metabolism protein YedF
MYILYNTSMELLDLKGRCCPLPVIETKKLLESRNIEVKTPFATHDKRILVFIDGETMGRGNDELGRILMKSFLYTLKELKPKPWRIIFINTGVKLVAEGSEYLNILKEIENLNVEILSCGTCLDYFHLKDKIKTGKASNMYDIVSSFIEATNVIKP